jgi:hypothetical protein
MSQIGYGPTDVTGAAFDVLTPLTAFVITARNGKVILNPAGTLATGTLNLPSGAPDGAVFQLMSTQTQTAITIAAQGTDLISGTALTALVANTIYEYTYTKTGSITPNAALTGASAPGTWIRTR